MSLRLNEAYASVQGEGPNVGRPTVFVRFAGCNLKCPGWPCDSQHAIDPKLFMKDSTVYDDIEELGRLILSYYSEGMGICFTGGEVLLQKNQDLECLFEYLQSHTGAEFELFTNGTFRMSRAFRNWFTTIVLDWKLPGSGELLRVEWDENVRRNLRLLGRHDAIKFTLKNRDDFEEARRRWNGLQESRKDGLDKQPRVVCGPVWGAIDERELVAWINEAELPWYLNVQLHKYIWPADARRT